MYLATRRTDGRKVAIKVLKAPNDENLQRFYREARILREQIHNPYVVDILEWGFEGHPAYIVMEFCAGGSLRSWVGQGVPWWQVCDAMSNAAAGLAEIHKVAGFHRDIKPDNLLLASLPGQPQIVKLGDFGLARNPHPSSGPVTMSPWGTRGYTAPELALGVSFSQRCDVYSLGVTAIELLTGTIDTSSIARRQDLPGELVMLLRNMTSPLLHLRPDISVCQNQFNALSLAHRLLVVSQPRPAPQQRAQREVAPTSKAGAGIFAAGLAVLGIAALATMNTRDADGRFRDSKGRFRSGRWR